jgi:hypothetical protein
MFRWWLLKTPGKGPGDVGSAFAAGKFGLMAGIAAAYERTVQHAHTPAFAKSVG